MTARANAPSSPATHRCDAAELGLEGIGFLLGMAHRAHRRRWEATLADLGLTAPQAAVLRLVTAEPGCGVRQLARRLGTDPMNIQRIVETLVANGLCTAGRDPADARRRPLHPTEHGRRLARQVADRARRTEQASMELLGDTSYRVVLDALRTLAEPDGGPSPGLAAHPRPGPPERVRAQRALPPAKLIT
ncbi:MAG: MarR family winged helix-turn-helix transcriptional regulator [Acidimicrobiales bacterium]